jgi:hypothetical protein
VQDVDKYDYELKKAAEKATENNAGKNARSFIEFNKNEGKDLRTTIHDAMGMFGYVFNLDKITKLATEIYQ